MKTIDWLARCLVASTWEICFIGLVFALLLACLKSPRLRHALAMLALVLCLFAPIATSVFSKNTKQVPGQEEVSSAQTPSSFEPSQKPAFSRQESSAPRPAPSDKTIKMGSVESLLRFRLLVWLWFAGWLLMSFRLLAGWSGVANLKRASRKAGEEWKALLEKVSSGMGLGRLPELRTGPGLALSAAGFWRPVVFAPAALFRLSPDMVEAALAHEIAHLLRNDYLTNAFQMVVESTLYYHPVVWLIGRVARREREHACDDLAVAYLGDRRIYVGALADIAGLATQPQPRLALGVSKSSLVERAQRVLGLSTSPVRLPWWLAACSLVAIGGGAVALCQGSLQTGHAARTNTDARFEIKLKILGADRKPIATTLGAIGTRHTAGEFTQSNENGDATFKLGAGKYEFLFQDLMDDAWSDWTVSDKGNLQAHWHAGITTVFDGQQWIVQTPFVAIQGQVFDADGAPVRPKAQTANVVEMYVPKLYKQGGHYAVNSSTQGSVEPDGKFSILVQAKSLVNPRFVFSMAGQTSDDGARIVNGLVTIHLHRVPKAWVTGTVLDYLGRPLAHSEVRLTGTMDDRSFHMLQQPKSPELRARHSPWETDAHGHYEFGPVNPGDTLWVTVAAPPGQADASSERMKVSPGENVIPTINLVAANLKLQGKVVDWQGKPVAGARVRCCTNAHNYETKSDSNGLFALAGLPANRPLPISADKGNADSWVNQEGHNGMVIWLHPPSQKR